MLLYRLGIPASLNCRPPALTARPATSYEQPTQRILGEGNLHDFEIRHKHLDGRSLEHIRRGSSDAPGAEVQQATNDAVKATSAERPYLLELKTPESAKRSSSSAKKYEKYGVKAR